MSNLELRNPRSNNLITLPQYTATDGMSYLWKDSPDNLVRWMDKQGLTPVRFPMTQ